MKLEYINTISAYLKDEAPFAMVVVYKTQGSTPRKKGASMLIGLNKTFDTIGGGMIELQLIKLVREQLNQILLSNIKQENIQQDFCLSLNGTKEHTALGVCGGQMHFRVFYSSLTPSNQLIEFCNGLKETLNQGTGYKLSWNNTNTEDSLWPKINKGSTESHTSPNVIVYPGKAHLIIFGGGHCGKALAHFAYPLGYRITIVDPQDKCKLPQDYPANTLFSDIDGTGIQWEYDNYAVLLTRSWKQDVNMLGLLSSKPCQYIGVMGSAKRLKLVKESFKPLDLSNTFWNSLHCPVGLDINAHTPEEIAVSILAEIIKVKNNNKQETQTKHKSNLTPMAMQ